MTQNAAVNQGYSTAGAAQVGVNYPLIPGLADEAAQHPYPVLKVNTVITEPSFVTDEYGRLWWVNPRAQYFSRAERDAVTRG